MTPVFVSLGGNLPETKTAFSEAKADLRNMATLKASSSLVETEPWNVNTKKTFLNQIVELTQLDFTPENFLMRLLEIEDNLGRNRSSAGPDRLIDLDLLYVGRSIRRYQNLRLPHPRLHKRPFILKLMVEIAPDFVHPVLLKTQTELLDNISE